MRSNSELTERERKRMAEWGDTPFRPTRWARRNLKPFAGLFIAVAVILVLFVAVILWFFLR